MSIRNKILYGLVHHLKISNKEAKHLLSSGQVLLNNIVCLENKVLGPYDIFSLQDGIVIGEAKQYVYYKLYKPRGIECTLNASVDDNLLKFLPSHNIFPIGRLDKESEGLVLLTNDGNIYETIARKHHVKKLYKVIVDKKVTAEQLVLLSNGIEIMGKRTLPCQVSYINEYSFYITLQQGLNRQIRRMCYKLALKVLVLARLAIGDVALNSMQAGQLKMCTEQEIRYLKSLFLVN